ncbi:MAG: helix-turn-helix domain-containing protein [Halodesulfurarchaeum sp.]
MTKLENISTADLHDALDEVEEKKPAQRLMLAILYKQGPSVPMIGDWFDMRDETIYRWFTEMEENPLMEAIYDKPRPGRPTKLAEAQRTKFEAALKDPPRDADLEASAWTPKLARKYLREEFDVDYSLRHVRRLMHEAGVSWQTPRSESLSVDGEEREVDRKDIKNT